MIKHQQNLFGKEGNCWQTAIASVMDLPLSEVPDFVNERITHWWMDTVYWLDQRGYKIIPIWGHLETDEYYLVSGPSPRFKNMGHVVIYQRGRMVHDPHPDGIGISEELHFDVIRKKD